MGVEQAAAASAVLAALSPAAIVSSDLQRAAMTADTLAALTGLTPRWDDRLREIHLGSWEGLTRDEVAEKFPDEWSGWISGDDAPRGGGETYAEVADRGATCVLEALDATEGLVIAVTHGGTARSTIGLLLELDPRSWWRLGPLGNCRWSVLVDGGQGWRLVEHNAGVPDVAVAVEERAGDDAR
ncbi:MAG: glucosyl-3-phosphoglycerate phosphatase [Frankiales bacterium]|nr:glucosyl-3-phosphoglycerate phosphatase [Frankiales bacterium]